MSDVKELRETIEELRRELNMRELHHFETEQENVRLKAALAEKDSWYSANWWRVVAPDGSLWAETSSEVEAQSRMREGDTLERMWKTEPKVEWRKAGD
jgi:hypothetical protein